jgi:cytochrome P450
MLIYDPFDFALHDDPYPLYQRMREEAPVYRNDDLDFWALSRYEDVRTVLRDHAGFSNAYGAPLETWGPEEYEIDPQGIRRTHGASTCGFSVLPTLVKPRPLRF